MGELVLQLKICIKLEPLMKYPKLTILFASVFVASWLFFSVRDSQFLQDSLVATGYLGIFWGGFFYAYGFTAAGATGLLLILAKSADSIYAGLIGGFGALISDILIYFFVRYSFEDEIDKLKKEKVVLFLGNSSRNLMGALSEYLIPFVASVIIASPLPTEIGVSLLAALKKMTIIRFIVLVYILHTLGIFVILRIGSMI